eukprot:6867462-Ditylum_brightwellii.AAC.2
MEKRVQSTIINIWHVHHFFELNKKELINFILIQCPEEKKSKLPKKEELEPAKNDEYNLIKIAFENQNKRSMLAEKHASILSTEEHRQKEAAFQSSRQLIAHTISTSITSEHKNISTFQPSQLLSNTTWISTTMHYLNLPQH